MNSKQGFAIEQLETRLEQFCYYYWYLGLCSVRVGWIKVYYPCWKVKLICF
jgi:hypothetical protein